GLAVASTFHQRFEIAQNETAHVGRLGMTADTFGLEDRSYLFGKADFHPLIFVVVVFRGFGGILGSEKGAAEAQRHEKKVETFPPQGWGEILSDASNHKTCLLLSTTAFSHPEAQPARLPHRDPAGLVFEELASRRRDRPAKRMASALPSTAAEGQKQSVSLR
ncbi:MAG TPA: hypothetical protein VHP35_07865, partial [Terriglobia bacterium]|nr:hypothetical protein [Terriglobia bacterium]